MSDAYTVFLETATREELIAKIENLRVEVRNLADLNRRAGNEFELVQTKLEAVRKAAR